MKDKIDNIINKSGHKLSCQSALADRLISELSEILKLPEHKEIKINTDDDVWEVLKKTRKHKEVWELLRQIMEYNEAVMVELQLIEKLVSEYEPPDKVPDDVCTSRLIKLIVMRLFRIK